MNWDEIIKQILPKKFEINNTSEPDKWDYRLLKFLAYLAGQYTLIRIFQMLLLKT